MTLESRAARVVWFHVVPLIAVYLGATAAAGAQAGTGTITGVVRDQYGAVVPGATITTTAAATSAMRVTITAADGVYAVPGLLPGGYLVEIELAGFQTVTRESVVVSTGETTRLDVELVVGGVDQQVTVRMIAQPLLRAERAGLGMVVDRRAVTELPLNGRTFISLTTLAPGVALPPGTSLPRINGGRPRTNEYLFDGISVLQPEPGQVAFFPVIDAIQEFKIESNSVSAEFGRFNGGVINLTTRSGTNTVHGTGFEFFRHEALSARNYFDRPRAQPRYRRNQFGGVLGGPVVKNRTFFFAAYQGQRLNVGRTITSTVPTLLQREGVFAEAVGGRQIVIYDPATTVSRGDGTVTRLPFEGNRIPAARFDPVAVALLQRYPLPTAGGTANNYTRTGTERDNDDQVSVRVDHLLSVRGDSVFVRVSTEGDDFVPVAPLPEGSGLTLGTLGLQKTRSWATASRYQSTIASRLVHELRIGDTRRTVSRAAVALPGPVSASLGIPGIPATARFPNTLPVFQLSGYQQLGSPINTAADFSTSVTQIADSVSWLAGRHAIKAGLDWRWQRLDVVQPPAPTGHFTFSSLFTDLPGAANTGSPLASFLLGQVHTFSIDLQETAIRNRAHVQEYFVQDDWKISGRVTLNLGLRYTLNFPSTEVDDQAAVFDLPSQMMVYLGRGGQPRSARRLHTSDFGPRVGVVARVSDRTIVSAGYGRVFIEQAGITTPFTTPAFPFVQTVSQRALDNATPAFVLAKGPAIAPIGRTATAGLGQGVFAVAANLGSGYVQQWNLAVQWELRPELLLEAAFVGSKGTRIGGPDTNLNQLTLGQLAQGPSLLAKVPNPYFGIIPRSSSLGDPTITAGQLLKPYPQYTVVSLYRNNVGTSAYRAVELSLRRRVSKGLSYSLSYTGSILKDDASSVFGASVLTAPVASFQVADSQDPSLERDYSTGHIPHVFVASAIWDLPYGRGRSRRLPGVWGTVTDDWTLSVMVTMQSGSPVAVTQATNFNAFAGFGIQRPNLVGDPELPAGQRTAAQWFNTAAFASAPQFTLGNASRNPIRGPSYRNVDVALVRTIPLGSKLTGQIRGEIFNLLNTVNLGTPNGTAGAPAFGTITVAHDPRIAQLALKVTF